MVGKWFGKNLYRKTLFVNSPSEKRKIISHGIENFDKIIFGTGRFQNSYVQELAPNNYPNWEVYIYDFTSSGFTLNINDSVWDRGVSDLYITLWYTKTTDGSEV